MSSLLSNGLLGASVAAGLAAQEEGAEVVDMNGDEATGTWLDEVGELPSLFSERLNKMIDMRQFEAIKHPGGHKPKKPKPGTKKEK